MRRRGCAGAFVSLPWQALSAPGLVGLDIKEEALLQRLYPCHGGNGVPLSAPNLRRLHWLPLFENSGYGDPRHGSIHVKQT
jgi:hypothetical protein